MNQQIPQCTSSKVSSGKALWSWGDELWGWTEDIFWSFPEDPQDDLCLFSEGLSVSQADAFMLPSTCQQKLGTAEPTGNPYTDFQDHSSLPTHISTATTQTYYQQQTLYASLGSPTHSQTPSLGISHIQSQGSPYSVGFIATPATMDLPCIPNHQGDTLHNGLQLPDVPVPAAFAQQSPNPTAQGLMGDHFPENPQAHYEWSYEQTQEPPAPNDKSGRSPKLSARCRRRKDKPEECPICGKGHAYKAELDRHIIAQHKDQAEQHALSVERFSCPHCSRDFARKDHLIRHRQRKHGLAKREKRSTKEV